MATEVEETIKRIQAHKGVMGVIIVNHEEINNRPATWNSLLPEYSNKVSKRNAWDELCQIFCNNFNEKTNKEKNLAGIPIKSSLDNANSVLYSGLIGQLTEKARNVVREMDSSNDLTFLRVRSKRHEILIAPDREFILIVIQNTSD